MNIKWLSYCFLFLIHYPVILLSEKINIVLTFAPKVSVVQWQIERLGGDKITLKKINTIFMDINNPQLSCINVINISCSG